MAVICALLFAAVHAPTSYESTFVEQTLSSPYCPVPTNEIKSSTSQQAVDVDGISEDIKHTHMSEMLRLHSNQVGDIALMYKVINLEREALERQHPWHPERAISCATFGSLLHTGYQECRDLALLDEAIRLNREALALRPRGHPQRALSCSNLATSLHAHHEQCGDLTLLQEAIQLKREALALRPLGHSERAVSCATLGSSLYTYYEQWDNVALLDEAIELEREALDLQPPGHPARATSCRDLGASLHARYQQCGDLTQLNEAIELEREALALRPPGHPQRADSCGVLSVSLCARYRRCGNVAMLDKAIELGREALALLPPDHPDRALGCANLGSSLQLYYEQYGAHAFLNESIMLSRDALGLRPPDHPQRADSCVTLGNSLHARYQQCGDLELLNEAIELKREALALRPPGHPQRGLSCASLGSTLHARYLQHRNSALLDEVIDLEREALALRPPGHPERAVSCANLGYSLHARYQQCADFDLLAEVVDLEREALSLQPPSHPQRSLSCRNLSYSLLDLFKRTHDSALLDEVLSICRSVLQDGTSSDALHSYTILSEVHLIPDTPHFSLTSALRYLNLSLEGDVDSIHGFIINTSCNLSRLWNFQTMWTVHTTRLLCSMYARLINQLPLAAGFVLDKPSQLQMLMSTRHIGRDACVVAVLAHQPAKAVELLDCAHGLVWTQALHQRNPPMEGAPPELAAELTRHLRAMAAIRMQLDDPSHHHQDALHHYNTRIQALLREIRVMPGLQHFMLGSTYDTLRNAARDHPVVVLVAGRGLAFALLMASAVEDEPQALHLDLTLEYVQWLQSATQKAGLRSGADSPAGDSDAVGLRLGFEKSGPHVYHKPLRVLAEIWHKIVKPVLDHLNIKRATGRSRPRLHWCGNGSFAFLPLHAAGIYQGSASKRVCCSDFVVSSYTPTVSALLRAQAQATSVTSSEVDMLLVGAQNPALSKLWNVRRELECIELVAKSQQFGRAVEVIGSAATVQQVTERVKSASFLHLACHGIQDQTNALESGFYLSDGKLTISKLMDLQLDKPWLAYLSACETAKGDAKQPDQVMHLTTAMLFAGFKHVVATMWSMDDADGPDLAEWFYEDVMSNKTIDADTVAYALDGAVQKLREKEPAPWRWAPFIHMGA